MVDSRLVDYIRRGLAEGYRIEHMERALIREGWRSKEIDEAIDAILDEREKAHLVGTQAEPLVYMTKVPELMGGGNPPEPPGQPEETPPEYHGEAPPEPHAEPPVKTMGIFTGFRMVLRHPGKFFQSVKTEKGYEAPVKYYLFLLFIQIIIANLVLYVSLTIGSAFFDPSLINPLMGIFALTTVTDFLFANIYLVLTIILLFVTAWFFNIFLRLFGGKGRMVDTFKGIVYSYTPNVILTIVSIPIMLLIFYSLIPLPESLTLSTITLETSIPELALYIISVVFLIWMVYLELKGLSVLHEISMPRVLTALIAAFAVFWIIITVVLGIVSLSSLLPSLLFY